MSRVTVLPVIKFKAQIGLTIFIDLSSYNNNIIVVAKLSQENKESLNTTLFKKVKFRTFGTSRAAIYVHTQVII